jgi:iron only hydrogenase large subunit-like protein
VSISVCGSLSLVPSKGVNVHQSANVAHPEVTGTFTVSAIYSLIRKNLKNLEDLHSLKPISKGSSYGMGWGVYGGEMQAAGLTNAIAVHGLDEVMDALEQMSMNKMPGLDYIECSACQSGCIGGPLVSENRFVAETNLRRRVRPICASVNQQTEKQL